MTMTMDDDDDDVLPTRLALPFEFQKLRFWLKTQWGTSFFFLIFNLILLMEKAKLMCLRWASNGRLIGNPFLAQFFKWYAKTK